jgi:hypothetical protein
MADVPEPEFREYWTQKVSSLKSQCPDITKKYPEAASVVQVHKVLSDIEILAECPPPEVGESSQWTTIVNSAKVKKANFCKVLERKPLFIALYAHVHGNTE